MSESESVRLVQAARLEVPASVAETMRQAGALDERYSADHVSRTVRQAVAAWAMAVDGDEGALAAIAEPDAAYRLLHPVMEPWQVAPGPGVTQIEVWRLETGGDSPGLRILFQFTGRRRFADPGQAENADGETTFVGLLNLTLAGFGSWRLSSGHVETLDEYLGYVFTSRRETPEEYHQRTGSSATPVAAAGPARRYRLIAGFAVHDEKFGSSAEIEVRRETPPARDEAEKLVWPAIWERIRNALGEGEYRPSLNRLDVVELLDEESPAEAGPAEAGPAEAGPQPLGASDGGRGQDQARLGEGLSQALRHPWKLTDAMRMSVDAFAERYALSRQLTYELTGETPGDLWFLTTIYPKRSHSFMRGRLGGGAQGLLWYAEKVLRSGRGTSRESWTVARYDIPSATRLAAGIACVPRQNPLRGGRLKLVSVLPRGLISVTVGDAQFDQTYEIGIVSDRDRPGVQALFTADFTAWMCELPVGKLGADATRFEMHADALCVYTKGAQRTTQTLDAFCQRAARIAAQIQRTSRAGPSAPA